MRAHTSQRTSSYRNVRRRHINREDHERAVLAAQARLLARALRPVRRLSRPVLKRLARARGWREGCFDLALHAAVQMELIELLPLGFCRCGRTGEASGGAHPLSCA